MMMIDYRRRGDLGKLAALQWVGVLGMVADHATRGLQGEGGLLVYLGLFGVTLPLMAFAVGLLVEVSSDEWKYFARLLGVGLLSQVVFSFSGVGGGALNDVLGLSLGLLCVIVERKRRWVGLGPCLVVGLLLGLWAHVLLVWAAWLNRDDQERFVAFVVVLAVGLVLLDVRFFAWVLGAVLLAVWPLVGFRARKLGRLMYWVYPLHLIVIGLSK